MSEAGLCSIMGQLGEYRATTPAPKPRSKRVGRPPGSRSPVMCRVQWDREAKPRVGDFVAATRFAYRVLAIADCPYDLATTLLVLYPCPMKAIPPGATVHDWTGMPRRWS